jgi:hypothetical protein
VFWTCRNQGGREEGNGYVRDDSEIELSKRKREKKKDDRKEERKQ